MIERRKAGRMPVDFTVRKHMDGGAFVCRACEIGPTGIKLKRIFDVETVGGLVDIEVPLVEGALTTALAARRVWHRSGFEAFEFISPSFAQQAMLERLFGNY